MKATFLSAIFTCGLVVASSVVNSSAQAQIPVVSQYKIASTQGNLQTVEEDDIKFQIQGCQRSGKNVTCSLLITKLSDENYIFQAGNFYSAKSRVIDPSGEEYASKLVQVGNQKTKRFLTINLIKGVPVKKRLVFEIPPSVNQAAVVELSYFLRGNGKRDIQKVDFRDIKFTDASASGR